MTTPSSIQEQLDYTVTLNSLRTKLAAVVSRIDSNTKYSIDGSVSPEAIFYTSEEDIDAALQELEDMKEQVDAIVQSLESLTVPDEYIGGSV